MAYEALQQSYLRLQNLALTDEQFEEERRHFFHILDRLNDLLDTYDEDVVIEMADLQDDVERIITERQNRRYILPPQQEQKIEFFETNRNNAIQKTTLITRIDPVAQEHIIDYYYKCNNSFPHVYKMNTIIDYCKSTRVGARNCKNCPVCNVEMNPHLYKQPPILSEIYETMFEKVLLKEGDEDYDLERVEYINKLVFLLQEFDNNAIKKLVHVLETRSL